MMDDYTKTPCVYGIISAHSICEYQRLLILRILFDVRFSRLHGRQPKMMDDYTKTPCVYGIMFHGGVI